MQLYLISPHASVGDWWASYGYEIPTLQRAAIRILSQPCSSYWYRWNWSTFESIHNKKRNKVEMEKFNDLLFVHCNLRLQAIYRSRDGKSKPIIYDEVDVSLEWPSESESLAPLLDDSWLDNLPLECRSSPWTDKRNWKKGIAYSILDCILKYLIWWDKM